MLTTNNADLKTFGAQGEYITVGSKIVVDLYLLLNLKIIECCV